jgi:AcrR family transcriptional regulator
VKQDKQDRRSQRTRRLVSSAMTELLREKRYDVITVQDLLDRAGIGRSKFYTHYFDKEDVLASLSEEMLQLFRQQLSQRDAGQGIIPSLELFRHVQENHQFFQAMLRGHAGDVLWETGQVLLSRNIEQALTTACAEKGSPSVPLPVVAQYLAGAFGSLLKWWLEAEMPYPPEQMERIFQQLALSGVWATIEGTSE